MRRLLAISATLAFVAVFAAQAVAFQCPKLVAQITAETGNRLDAASNSAKEMAAEATKLHGDKKHAESEAKAKEALKLLGKM